MPYELTTHLERTVMRSDLTQRLSHLTRARFDPAGNMTTSALDNLLTILEYGQINGSTSAGFICGDTPAVCLQDTPIYNLGEVFYQEKLTKDEAHPPATLEEHDGTTNRFYRYTLYGVSFDKAKVWAAGGRPAIYEDSDVSKGFLPPNEWWRIVDLDWGNLNALVDWTHEREWRVPNQYQFQLSETVVLLPGKRAYQAFMQHPRQQQLNFANSVAGIVTVSPLLH